MSFRHIGNWVMHNDTATVGLEFAHDIDDLRISQVAGTSSLKVRPSTIIGRSLTESIPHQLLDGLLGDELAHAVIDAATGR